MNKTNGISIVHNSIKLVDKLKEVGNDYPAINSKILITQKTSLSASFVIPTYNSANSISLVLSAINNQLLVNHINEVIVIDNGSDDETEQVIKKAQPKLSIKIIYQKSKIDKNVAAARNEGIYLATGDVICFIDSDIIIPPDYLNYHLVIHEKIPNLITLSMRSFIDKSDYQAKPLPFPITNYINEFRIEKYIDPKWCDTKERQNWAGKVVHLLHDSDYFKKLGYHNNLFWSLPEICLTCAICYKRSDLITVKGAPINFVGWGFQDTTMAAKVISLNNFVIPLMEAGVYHLKHSIRSKNKQKEFKINQSKYRKMLQMDQVDTFKEYLEEIE